MSERPIVDHPGINDFTNVVSVPGKDGNDLITRRKYRGVAVSSSGVAYSGPCYVVGARCISGSNVKLTLYAGLTTGAPKWFGNGAANGINFNAGDTQPVVSGAPDVFFPNGVYAEVNGTSPVFMLFLEPAL